MMETGLQIGPYWCGVASTLLAELVLLCFAAGFAAARKKP
jgi:hypothetical protein